MIPEGSAGTKQEQDYNLNFTKCFLRCCPQPHWPPPASSNKEKIEGPLAAGRSLAAQVALTASAIPNLDGGEISREGSPQPEAFVPLLWLGWPGSAAFSPPFSPGHTGLCSTCTHRQAEPTPFLAAPPQAGRHWRAWRHHRCKGRGTSFLLLHFWY